MKTAAQKRGRSFQLFAVLAVALVSWTYPRAGFLKFTELFGVLGATGALRAKHVERELTRCFWPFVVASLFAFAVSLLTMQSGDSSLSSEKGLYSDPSFVPIVTLLRLTVYLLCVATLTSFFMCSDRKQVKRSLVWAYYFTLAPGLLQMFRIYSGVHFDLPLERPDLGPFSGVFDAGYLRLMGFEFEPLGYATSLVVVCCVRLHSTRKLPWLGLIVLYHTYSAGAIGGLIIALIVSRIPFVLRWFVLIYAIVATAVFAYIATNFTELSERLFFFQSAMERVSAINASVSMILDYPFGVGLGFYGYFYNLYNPFGFYEAPSLDHYPNNDLAMFLAYGGLLYAAAYLYIFHYALRRVKSFWLCIALLALMIQSFTSYLFFNPAIILVLSLILSGSIEEASKQAGVSLRSRTRFKNPFRKRARGQQQRPPYEPSALLR